MSSGKRNFKTEGRGFLVHIRHKGSERIVTPRVKRIPEHFSLADALAEAERLANVSGSACSVFSEVGTVLPGDGPALLPKLARAPIVEVRRRRANSAGGK